ncbi:hypothetical protein NMG60_11007281 [Bertholletia excelsa]
MLLGKRQRGPMRRTASMAGIDADLGDVEETVAPDGQQDGMTNGEVMVEARGRRGAVVGGPSGFDHRVMAVVSPRFHRRSSTSGGVAGGSSNHAVTETAHFLTSCGLCKRRLSPGRDIYMYRGDAAFCSQECREQQMKNDEKTSTAGLGRPPPLPEGDCAAGHSLR